MFCGRHTRNIKIQETVKETVSPQCFFFFLQMEVLRSTYNSVWLQMNLATFLHVLQIALDIE